ncbi:MAG TPA: MFS transporter, partial [Acidobacteriaceae bacterium]
MMHRDESALSEASPSYAGWRVVVAAFVGVMVSFAAIVPYTFSQFLDPLHAAFGWGRAAMSTGFAIAAMTVALFSPGIGMLLDRVPPRRVLLPSIVVFAVALASLSRLTPSIGRFYFTFFLIGVVGNGTAQLAYSRAVLTWFRERRGMALAIMLTGSGTGSIVIPQIVHAVMHRYGWREAYLTLGMLAMLGLPLTAWLVRNRPLAGRPADEGLAAGNTLREVLRSPVFWLLSLIVLLPGFGANGLISHLAALLTQRGLSGQSAATALSMLGAFGIAGRLVTGALLDRCFAPRLAVVMLGLAACGTLLLAYASTATAAIAGTAIVGFSLGSEADITPYLIARFFGRKRFSTVYGLSWTAYAIGGATGPMLMGRLYDRFGGYQPRFVVGLACTCLAAAALNL